MNKVMTQSLANHQLAGIRRRSRARMTRRRRSGEVTLLRMALTTLRQRIAATMKANAPKTRLNQKTRATTRCRPDAADDRSHREAPVRHRAQATRARARAL